MFDFIVYHKSYITNQPVGGKVTKYIPDLDD